MIERTQLSQRSGFVLRYLTIAICLLSAFWLMSFPAGCSDNASKVVISDLPDTSYFRILDLHYDATNDTAGFNSGIQFFWDEFFYSNYRKSCQIQRYLVFDSELDTLFRQDHSARFIQQKDTLHAQKTLWIDIDAPTAAGVYRFQIDYRHSNQAFVFDTTLDVISVTLPRQSDR